MKCPRCGGRIKVIETADITSSNEIYRKRKCDECAYIFYTAEFEVEHDKKFIKEWSKYRGFERRKHGNH